MAHFVSTVYATHTSVGSYFLLSVTLGLRPRLLYVTRASAGLKVRLPSSASPTPRPAPLAHPPANINLLHCELASRMFNFKIQNSKSNFSTAFGRVKSGLKPAVKNRTAHGSEDCAARRVKTKADALGIGGQTPICTRPDENPPAVCTDGGFFFARIP